MTERVTARQPRAATVVLVFGASSGIGRETALGFAGRGANLVLAARAEAALVQVAAACRLAGAAEVMVCPTDVGEADQVEWTVAAAVRRFGRLDVAVNAAAVAIFGTFVDVPREMFDAVLRTNVTGSANVARSTLARFRDQSDGHLVLVGSLLGRVAVPYMAAYVVSKFAVHGLVRVLRQENRDLPGVRVHGIYPGAVDTPIYGNAGNYTGHKAHVQPGADDLAKLAAAIVRATDRRRSSERQVGRANRPLLTVNALLPAVFDAVVGPAMRLGGFTRRLVVSATSGNVLEPAPAAPEYSYTGRGVDGRSRGL